MHARRITLYKNTVHSHTCVILLFVYYVLVSYILLCTCLILLSENVYYVGNSKHAVGDTVDVRCGITAAAAAMCVHVIIIFYKHYYFIYFIIILLYFMVHASGEL